MKKLLTFLSSSVPAEELQGDRHSTPLKFVGAVLFATVVLVLAVVLWERGGLISDARPHSVQQAGAGSGERSSDLELFGLRPVAENGVPEGRRAIDAKDAVRALSKWGSLGSPPPTVGGVARDEAIQLVKDAFIKRHGNDDLVFGVNAYQGKGEDYWTIVVILHDPKSKRGGAESYVVSADGKGVHFIPGH